MGRKKKFIDKKKSATFALLYRESGDGEEIGGERVYTRVDGNAAIRLPGFEQDDDDDSRFADAEEEEEEGELEAAVAKMEITPQGLPEHVRRELVEMGFPDDGYNYMKHMRSIGAGGGSVFVPTTSETSNVLPADFKAYDASKVPVKEAVADESASNTTNLRPIRSAFVKVGGLDPEVAAVLEESDFSDDDGDESDGLEDDFILIANEGVEEEAKAETSNRKDLPPVKRFEEEEEEEVRSFAAMAITNERANGILDEQFEVLTSKEYDCDVADFGDDDPRARGQAHISEFTSIFDEFLAENPSFASKPVQRTVKQERLEEVPAKLELVVQEYEEFGKSSESAEEELETVWVAESDDDKKAKWDCETIVSTLSNLDNHPSRIGAPVGKRVDFSSIRQAQQQVIRIGGKQKLPLDFVTPKTSEVSSERKKESEPHKKTAPLRQKGESKEEHKARKSAVKEERRAARMAKKELKTRFKIESQRAQSGAAVAAPPTIHL
ncbi:protein LTV1 homolog [Selaginella moellendorffii]|nr:protein LTV1 homolog [Selaginella moellendorffii]XP_024527591.1 protein LTV1 homolog [Selaginella moellendorffii]|eukprot:XP_002967416.2 protein LTV1 homolog [Selaginella moellendorffii]